MTSLQPVILCGGSGSRLWPLSRAGRPKQLLPLAETQTMLQATAARLAGLEPASPLVVCNEAHRFMIREQLEHAGLRPTLVLEPVGRNTAPAVTVAALLQPAAARPDTLLLVLPADHVIRDTEALIRAVGEAVPAAGAGQLITFGIIPDAPETGYGYIRAAAEGEGVRAVERFVEKPDFETARRYVQSGDFYWNSGMFLFSAGAWLEEVSARQPGMLEACRKALDRAAREGDAVRLDAASFCACPADSIDYAVMEHTERAGVVPLDAGWSDVGSWASLREVSSPDSAGNVSVGDVLALDCEDSYLRAESRLVAAVGLRGCIVVETKDAVLVVPGERAQDVRKLVDELKAAGREEADLGREVFRPWGSYDSLENAGGFQVKRLNVAPGAILSLQLHHRRAEHWVVVAGTARVTRGEEVVDLQRNDYIHIPVGTKHRIENPGTEMLKIIEVQVGDYLGEDDIVRFEDKYGREGRTD